MVADPDEANGLYEWVALLSWTGERPTADEIAKLEMDKRGESYRAKVLRLDASIAGTGVASGVLQITAGPGYTGERVVFTREQLYVFGARMAKADISYVLSENDKVQLEVESLMSPGVAEEYRLQYGCDIRLRATLVWVGPLPKLDQNCDDFPVHVGSVIFPYLSKRSWDEEFFTRLIKGELPPKTVPTAKDSAAPPLIPPNYVHGRIIELKRPESPEHGCEHGILLIETGPDAGQRAFLNRNVLWCFGNHMLKVDLMRVVKETDRFGVEVRSGTNNKSVPFVVTLAWAGPHPEVIKREPDALETLKDDPGFQMWLGQHGFKSKQEFDTCVAATTQPVPFFPLPLEKQNARIAHIFPHNKTKPGNGCEFGVLKIHQGSLEKKDVLFERRNVYLWNVPFLSGDISYVLKESDRVFCEVTEILGKERKKWQVRLNSQKIPKHCATIVYIGGGRPKGHDPSQASWEALTANSNLRQWLGRRNINLEFFKDLIDGKVPPMKIMVSSQKDPPPSCWDHVQESDVPQESYTNSGMHEPPTKSRDEQLADPGQCPPRLSSMADYDPPSIYRGRSGPSDPLMTQGSFGGQQNLRPLQSSSSLMSRGNLYPDERAIPPNRPGPQAIREAHVASSRQPLEPRLSMPATRDTSTSEDLENPIIKQAKALLGRVMSCTTPEDPKVVSLIVDDSEVALAMFVAKTLEQGVAHFKRTKNLTNRRTSPSHSDPALRSTSLHNTNMKANNVANSAALYGLNDPLLPYDDRRDRQNRREESITVVATSRTSYPAQSSADSFWQFYQSTSPDFNSPNEPPYKRKLQDPPNWYS